MVTIEYMNFMCESDLKGPDSSELPPFAELMLRCPRAVVEEVAYATRITYSSGILIPLEVWYPQCYTRRRQVEYCRTILGVTK